MSAKQTLAERFTLQELLRGGAYADVSARLNAHPEEANADRMECVDEDEDEEDEDESGYCLTPLELALHLGAPADVVEAIVKLLPPEKLLDEGEDGTPLRQALLCGASVEVLRVLLSASPRGIADYYQPGEGGFSELLLHAAAERCSLEVVTLLITYPDLAKEADDNGNFALHVSLGAREQPSEEPWTSDRFDHAKAPSVLALLDAYPQAARLPNTRKLLPLHYAVQYGAPEVLVRRLLAAHPEAAATSCGYPIGDPIGYLPAHYALGTARDWVYSSFPACSPGVQAALLDAHPLSAWGLRHLLYGGSHVEEEMLRRLQASREGDFSTADCLHIAAEHGAPERVLSALMRLDSEYGGGWLQAFDARGYLPLHYAKSPSAVRLLANAYPAALTAGVHKRDGPKFAGPNPPKRARQGDAFWPLHRAIHWSAPQEVIEALEELTPMDAFGNRPFVMPRLRKCSGRDVKNLRVLTKALPEPEPGPSH